MEQPDILEVITVNTIWIVLAVLLAIGIAVGAFFIIRKQQYVSAIRKRGWQWVESPHVGITVGLNHPPFGIGFDRSVDDQVIGTTSSGVGFQAFRYRAQGFRSNGYVVTMRLPKPLPELYVFPESAPRPHVTGEVVSPGPLLAISTDVAFGSTAAAAVMPAVSRGLVTSQGQPLGIDVGTDHDQLVMLHVPRPVEDLALAVEWLAEVHRALVSSEAMGFTAPPPPPHLSFHNRDHWEYSPRDDSMLSLVNHTRGGHGHRAENIIRSGNFGLPFIRLTHHWETTHTRTNAKGESETYTQHHEETLCEFATTFPFREISVNWGMFGNKVRFESTAFNNQFTVRSPVARFASDVMHPRQLEFLLRTRPIPFSIEADGRILAGKRDWLPDELDWFDAFLRGFFGRVPDFTWKELGAWPRPIAEVEDYNR